jgi:hypothetical protein
MNRIILPLVTMFLFACSHVQDRSLIITENGVVSASDAWDIYYNAKADSCESRFEPQTPEMEECFGETYDIDAQVKASLESIIILLREYWHIRAAGGNVNWADTVNRVMVIIDSLPTSARKYFERVKGL